MVDLLVLTVLLPLLGAVGIFLSSSILSRFDIKRGYERAVIATLALGVVVLVSVLVVGGRQGGRIALSSLYPSLLAESVVEIRWDTTLWPLGLGLLATVGAFILVAVGVEHHPLRLVSRVLALLSAGLAALWSANPLTTIVCWAFYDLIFTLSRITVGDGRKDAVWSLAIGTCAGLLLWVGVLVAESGIGSVQWALMPAGGAKMTYWMSAGLLRLGAYPLHLWFVRKNDASSPLVGALALSPVLGWGLWIRLALISDQALPVGAWATIPALLSLVAGGILAWTANSPRDSRPWISLGGNGAVLLAVSLASMQGEAVVPTIILGALAWMLSTALLFSAGGRDLSGILRGETLPGSIPAVVGALSLIGTPATLGFAGESLLMEQLGSGGRWGWSIGFCLGQLFLVAAVIRWLLASDATDRASGGLLGEVARDVGLMILAIPLVVIGVIPAPLLVGIEDSPQVSVVSMLTAPNLAGWILWGGAVLLGGGLAWLGARLRSSISLWLDAVHDVLLLDWGYELLMGAFEQGFSLVRVVDDVLGGRGALLWACVLVLILILAVGG